MSLNLPRTVFEELKRVSVERGVTMTEIIRRGIELERFLLEHPPAREWLRRLREDEPRQLLGA